MAKVLFEADPEVVSSFMPVRELDIVHQRQAYEALGGVLMDRVADPTDDSPVGLGAFVVAFDDGRQAGFLLGGIHPGEPLDSTTPRQVLSQAVEQPAEPKQSLRDNLLVIRTTFSWIFLKSGRAEYADVLNKTYREARLERRIDKKVARLATDLDNDENIDQEIQGW